MNINTLLGSTLSSLLGSGAAASQATATSAAPARYFAQAEQRIQADADITTAQISQFGQLKSALSDSQGAAQALSTLSSSSSSAEATAALGQFFNRFNAVVGAAQAAATASDAPAESDRAQALLQDFRSALRADPATQDAMQHLGLTLQADGRLVQDPQQFATAFATDPGASLDSMAKLGRKVDAVSSAALASGGRVDTALAALRTQGAGWAAQQSALQALDQTMASFNASNPFATSDSPSTPSPAASLLGSGLAAYQSTMAGL